MIEQDDTLRVGQQLTEFLGHLFLGASADRHLPLCPPTTGPPGLWREVSGDLADFPVKTHTYERDRGAPLYRRSVYVFWKRASPPPMLAIFDAQGRDVCSVRQSSTNTPLQALNLLNDVAFVETARLLAARMLIEGGPSFATRLEYGFELLLARPPAPLETQLLQDSFAEHLRDYQSNPDAAHPGRV